VYICDLPPKHSLSLSEDKLMEVWFPRREYAVVQAPQGHSYDRICCHENDPGQSLVGKLRCVQYSINMTSVFAKECVDHEKSSYRERNAAQTRYSLWWLAQWAPTTQH